MIKNTDTAQPAAVSAPSDERAAFEAVADALDIPRNSGVALKLWQAARAAAPSVRAPTDERSIYEIQRDAAENAISANLERLGLVSRAAAPMSGQRDDIRPAAWTRHDLLCEVAKLESVIELGNRNTQMWKDRALAVPVSAVEQFQADCAKVTAALKSAAPVSGPGEFGQEVTRLVCEIRKATSLAWRDGLIEQLLELIEPSPEGIPAAPVSGQGYVFLTPEQMQQIGTKAAIRAIVTTAAPDSGESGDEPLGEVVSYSGRNGQVTIGLYGDTPKMGQLVYTRPAPAAHSSAPSMDVVRKFVTDCAATSGGMINGNHLARYASKALAALAAPSPTAHSSAPSKAAVNAHQAILDKRDEEIENLRSALTRMTDDRDGWRKFGREQVSEVTRFANLFLEKSGFAAPSPTVESVSVPEGWKMVPIDLTDDMLIAFAEVWFCKVRCIDDCEMEDAYAAMLAAAPTGASK